MSRKEPSKTDPWEWLAWDERERERFWDFYKLTVYELAGIARFAVAVNPSLLLGINPNEEAVQKPDPLWPETLRELAKQLPYAVYRACEGPDFAIKLSDLLSVAWRTRAGIYV